MITFPTFTKVPEWLDIKKSLGIKKWTPFLLTPRELLGAGDSEEILEDLNRIEIGADKRLTLDGRDVLIYLYKKEEYRGEVLKFRYHIAECETMRKRIKNPKKRLVASSRTDGRLPTLVLRIGKTYPKRETPEYLVCQYCLGELNYNNFRTWWNMKLLGKWQFMQPKINKIVTSFDPAVYLAEYANLALHIPQMEPDSKKHNETKRASPKNGTKTESTPPIPILHDDPPPPIVETTKKEQVIEETEAKEKPESEQADQGIATPSYKSDYLQSTNWLCESCGWEAEKEDGEAWITAFKIGPNPEDRKGYCPACALEQVAGLDINPEANEKCRQFYAWLNEAPNNEEG